MCKEICLKNTLRARELQFHVYLYQIFITILCLQTNVSLLAKQQPSEDYAEISQSLFFSLPRRILCVCEKKNSRTLSPQALLQKIVFSYNETMRCCIVSRRETDTFVPRLRFLIIPVRERDALWKMIKNIVYT